MKCDNNKQHYAMVAYRLANTLSHNGTVSRGACVVENGFLKTVLFILKESSNPRSCFKNSYKQYLKNNKLLKLLGRKFGKF